MAAGLYAPRGIEMTHQRTGSVIKGWNVKLADNSSDLISDHKPAFLRLNIDISYLCLLYFLQLDYNGTFNGGFHMLYTSWFAWDHNERVRMRSIVNVQKGGGG